MDHAGRLHPAAENKMQKKGETTIELCHLEKKKEKADSVIFSVFSLRVHQTAS